MSDWKPKAKGVASVMHLELSGEEGFVLSRIDGATDVRGLQHLTGLPEERVQEILERLVETGAVHAPEPTVEAAVPVGIPGLEELSGLELAELLADDLDDLDDVDAPSDGLATLEDQEPLFDTDEDGRAEDGRGDINEVDANDNDANDEDDDANDDDAGDDDGSEDDDGDGYATYRALFEAELHPLPRDQRVEMARDAEGATLCAFCFDPDPGVIRAVLENLKTGLEQARLIATHHRNPVGLDALAHRATFLRDGQVQRLLLRNPQTSDGVLRRLLQNKPLVPLFALTRSRELTERAKRNVRQAFRRAFQRADAEERVGLLFSTEGRCLNGLIGLSFDTKTTALLCGRTYSSSLLIQNLARFAATPPNVLQHLFKQSVVRRTPHLKQLVLQHPNCPSQLKRQVR